MDEKLTPSRLLRIWWAWQWRTVVATFVGSFVLIFLFALVGTMLGMDRHMVMIGGNLIYLGVGVFASIHFLGWVLRRDFGDFRLNIEEKERTGRLSSQERPPALWAGDAQQPIEEQ